MPGEPVRPAGSQVPTVPVTAAAWGRVELLDELGEPVLVQVPRQVHPMLPTRRWFSITGSS